MGGDLTNVEVNVGDRVRFSAKGASVFSGARYQGRIMTVIGFGGRGKFITVNVDGFSKKTVYSYARVFLDFLDTQSAPAPSEERDANNKGSP